MDNHYTWLEQHLPSFFTALGINWDWHGGIISAHGDKCYSYRQMWEDNGVPFYHGVAIYLLTYTSQYSNEVRNTDDRWVDPGQWVVDNYERFKHLLVEIPQSSQGDN